MRYNHSNIAGLVLLMLGLLFSSTGQAQVGEVNENIEKSKETKSTDQNSTNTESSGGDGFFVFLADIFVHTIGAAQMAALENKHIYPERVGFNAGADLGYGFTRNTWNITTQARLNWGVFGSDFKFNSLSDLTGKLNTIDWQVVVLRLPIQSFNLEYGLGFIAIPKQSESYGSFSFGFDFKIRAIGTTLGSHYYWSSITSLDTRFRRAFEVTGDVEVIQNGHFHLCLLAKYSYQNYFEETNFNIAGIGVVLKFY